MFHQVLSVIKSFQVDSSENASYIYLLNNMHDNDEAFRQHYETVHNFPYKPLGNDVPLLRQIPTTDEMNMTSQYQSAEDMLLSGIPSLNQAPPTTLNYYYYPDSDLETIIEESSVLDSEDERSPRFNHNPINSFPMNRRNTGNRRSSYDSDLMGESSDSLHSTLSDASSRGDLINSYQQKQGHFLDAGGVLRKDTQTVQHSPQSSLLSGSFSTDEGNYIGNILGHFNLPYCVSHLINQSSIIGRDIITLHYFCNMSKHMIMHVCRE